MRVFVVVLMLVVLAAKPALSSEAILDRSLIRKFFTLRSEAMGYPIPHADSDGRNLGLRAESFFDEPAARAAAAAIERGDVAAIDRLIARGLNINTRGKSGMTLLFFSLGFPGKMPRVLLERGADPNVPLGPCEVPIWGKTATQIIAEVGSSDDFEYLLDRGVDPNMLSSDTYRPLIHFAFSSAGNLEVLLKRGVDVNQQGAHRGTGLINYPIWSPDALLMYLKAGGNYRSISWPNSNLLFDLAGGWMKDGTGNPLGDRERCRHACDWLEQHEGVNLAKVREDFEHTWNSLEDSTGLRTLSMWKKWLPPAKERATELYSDSGAIALIRAIERDDSLRIMQIVKSGVDINVRGKAGVTPLFCATQAQFPTFALLLELGADPNIPLQASFFPNAEQWLGKGDTLVHWAARYGGFDHLEKVLKHGGNANARRAYCHWTPVFDALDIGEFMYDIQEAIESHQVQYGEDYWPKQPRREARLAAIALLATRGKADLNAQDCWGRTPVMVAWKQRAYDIVPVLLRLGASARRVDREGYDLMLLMLREVERPRDDKARENWRKEHREIIEIIEERGGNFAIAEQVLWRPGKEEPRSELLEKMDERSRPWLPQG